MIVRIVVLAAFFSCFGNVYARFVVMNQDPAASLSDAWPEFSKAQKEKYPCVLVLKLDNLNHSQILSMTSTESRYLQTLFSLAPAVVMNQQQIQNHLKEAPAAENIFLVTLDGKILKKSVFDFTNVDDPGKAISQLENFLNSDKIFQEAWQKFAPKADAKKVELLLKTIDEGTFRERKKAKEELIILFKDNAFQVLEQARLSKSVELRESCRDIMIKYRGVLPLISAVPAAVQNAEHLQEVLIRDQW